MKKLLSLIIALSMTVSLLAGCSSSTEAETSEDGTITIEYWQYVFDAKVDLIDELIVEFEAANPGIKVEHKNFPYADYEQKLAAEIAATHSSSDGPNIINIFYGWVPKYVQSGVLAPLPEESFPTSMIDEEFAPMVQINKIEGTYYTIPTAVRTSALFYNKTLLEEEGYTIEDVPTDLIEYTEFAEKLTIWDGDTLVRAGQTWEPNGQYHSWFRPVLMTQFGATPISADGKTANWESEEAIEAFEFFMSQTTDYKLGAAGFYTDDVTAFSTGNAVFHVDGSYRLGSLHTNMTEHEWGVVPLPTYEGNQGSFGSFWTNGITAKTMEDEEKAAASVKFLEFLSSEEVMVRWTQEVGEIGARSSIATYEEFTSDPTMAPFIDALDYATSYFYVDEAADKQIIMTAIDEVLLNGKTPEEALIEADAKAQELLDEYWEE